VTVFDLWLEALGRLHPVLLHFPLALAVAAAIVETIQWLRRRPSPAPSTITILVLGAISAPLAAASGWMNARFGGDSGETLEWHRWSGVIAASGLVLVAIVGVLLHRRAARAVGGNGRGGDGMLAAFRVGLLVVAAIAGYCGHLGGELKWGTGYTTEVLWRALRASVGLADSGSMTTPAEGGAGANTPSAPSPELVRFDAHVLPVLAQHCSECHLGGRRKGRLSLAQLEAVVRANDDGVWLVRAGAPDESELLRRVTLPPDDLDTMPPDGPRLSETEIEIIRRWIEQGAG